MTDLVLTPANVVPGANAIVDTGGRAGVTIVAGQAVYKEAATGLYKLADSNSAAESKTMTGLALNGAATNQPLHVQLGGDITLGAVLTAGMSYFLSETPGGIEPVADQGAGEYVNLIGVAKSTTVLTIRLIQPGVTL